MALFYYLRSSKCYRGTYCNINSKRIDCHFVLSAMAFYKTFLPNSMLGWNRIHLGTKVGRERLTTHSSDSNLLKDIITLVFSG